MLNETSLTAKGEFDASAYVNALAIKARDAARKLNSACSKQKNAAILEAAGFLRQERSNIISANKADIAGLQKDRQSNAFIDRLTLNESRVENMAVALETIASLQDPVGRILSRSKRPNGLNIEQIAVPIGVIGMIYESRPNVGADAGALCLKSGNAVLLRCGSESLFTSREIVNCLHKGLIAAQLPKSAISLLDTKDRTAVGALLRCSDYVDVIIPRGGKSLVSRIQKEAKVPTLLHLDGNCHVYVHAAADLYTARTILTNSKLRRTGICGAAESLVIDRAVAAKFLPQALDGLNAITPTQMRGETEAQSIDKRILAATDADFGTEYLDAILSVKIVSGYDEAVDFIHTHHSGHTDAIITNDEAIAERFLNEIDSAIVMVNASTQFADGGEFGMGAEIGIATGKLHARGPVGLEQLTSFKVGKTYF